MRAEAAKVELPILFRIAETILKRKLWGRSAHPPVTMRALGVFSVQSLQLALCNMELPRWLAQPPSEAEAVRIENP